MSLEYKFDYVRGDAGGAAIAELATNRGSEGWRLATIVCGTEGFSVFFERRLLTRKEHLTPPEDRNYRMNPDWRDGGDSRRWLRSSIADAPPLEVPSALSKRPEVDSEWEAIREVLRQQTGRLGQLEQIIRRRDEVILIARRFEGWTINSKHYIDDDVELLLAALARLDEEEKPRDQR